MRKHFTDYDPDSNDMYQHITAKERKLLTKEQARELNNFDGRRKYDDYQYHKLTVATQTLPDYQHGKPDNSLDNLRFELDQHGLSPELDQIAWYLIEGYTQAEISELLGVDAKVISRQVETIRNTMRGNKV